MNANPHVHEPRLMQEWDYSDISVNAMGIRYGEPTIKGWILSYGDTKIKIPGEVMPGADQRRTALLAAVAEHDEGSKHEDDLFAAVLKLEGKKVWASEVLAAPPKKHWWQKAQPVT